MTTTHIERARARRIVTTAGSGLLLLALSTPAPAGGPTVVSHGHVAYPHTGAAATDTKARPGLAAGAARVHFGRGNPFDTTRAPGLTLRTEGRVPQAGAATAATTGLTAAGAPAGDDAATTDVNRSPRGSDDWQVQPLMNAEGDVVGLAVSGRW